ncbi:hypothetical protein K461DRAFT_274505 [Myriangium duriaei CBS 260.36]|uniref:Uncharacterized protein n=1 Tax=Myriangium duriaei CBS 260.36 TaxID=1168546 RepID=A0A9P4J628_9PEZI|nr:hypothetical protein K461DRAFT_274505 [Myriangium duriaei CBS 260.36]
MPHHNQHKRSSAHDVAEQSGRAPALNVCLDDHLADGDTFIIANMSRATSSDLGLVSAGPFRSTLGFFALFHPTLFSSPRVHSPKHVFWRSSPFVPIGSACKLLLDLSLVLLGSALPDFPPTTFQRCQHSGDELIPHDVVTPQSKVTEIILIKPVYAARLLVSPWPNIFSTMSESENTDV